MNRQSRIFSLSPGREEMTEPEITNFILLPFIENELRYSKTLIGLERRKSIGTTCVSADIVVYLDAEQETPAFVVEVKTPKKLRLSIDKHIKQVISYGLLFKADYSVLSDGESVFVYQTDTEKVVYSGGLENSKPYLEMDVLTAESPLLLSEPAYSPRAPVRVEKIQHIVAKHHAVSVHDLISKKRFRRLAHARQLAMYLVRKHTNMSYPEIGYLFGGRDHTTVLYACSEIERRLQSDATLKEDLENFRRLLLLE